MEMMSEEENHLEGGLGSMRLGWDRRVDPLVQSGNTQAKSQGTICEGYEVEQGPVWIE